MKKKGGRKKERDKNMQELEKISERGMPFRRMRLKGYCDILSNVVRSVALHLGFVPLISVETLGAFLKVASICASVSSLQNTIVYHRDLWGLPGT